MADITKCYDCKKYCKSYKTCYRHTAKDDTYQSYALFHHMKKIDKCENYWEDKREEYKNIKIEGGLKTNMNKQIKCPRILIYDDENINYREGYMGNLEMVAPEYIEYTFMGDTEKHRLLGRDYTFSCQINNFNEHDTIKLDPTIMKRIAKYNKEQECLQLDEKIKEKEEKIKELDDILNDRENRVKKLKDYIKDIWEININEEEDDYEW